MIEPSVHGDQRGYFMETYNQKDMEEAGLTMKFVQDNQSGSGKAVLRGLHFQKKYPSISHKCLFNAYPPHLYPGHSGTIYYNHEDLQGSPLALHNKKPRKGQSNAFAGLSIWKGAIAYEPQSHPL